MTYGYFDDAAREYVITDPKTPVKWINYIGTLAFGGFVDHTGGALLCRQDPTLNRITKYVSQLPASEFKGETAYVRIREPKQADQTYGIFSPYFVPTLDPYDRYECHVGLGYTRIVSEFYGIRGEITIFVPLDEPRALRDYRITNLSDRTLEIDIVPVVEYTHPDSLKQLTNADWVPQTMQSRAHAGSNGSTVLVQYPFMLRDTRINYFTSNHAVSSFETDRREFLGDNEYGTWAHPLSLARTELGNNLAHRGDNIAALMHHLGIVPPGETVRLITQLGQDASLESALLRIGYFQDEQTVDRALAELAHFWDEYLGKLQVHTPDVDMNRMLNIHNPRQCHTTKNWSRYLSLYQLGYGSRGIGFRDSSQDVMAVLASIPNEAKELLKQLLAVQKSGGSAMHQFNPLTLVASEGESVERGDLPHYYGDDHLWIILAVCAYLKETGDLAFLAERIPYYDTPQEATVLEHLQCALEFTRGDVGGHGLPLLGFADWNDTVNLRPGAESLFTANLYGKALLDMIEVAQFLGDMRTADKFAADYMDMKARVNDWAWDGEWYVRYFDCDGTPLGSHMNEQGQIYINACSWPVLSGFATPERARSGLDALRARLNTRNGIKISAPGFNAFDPRRGGITTYPPGAKENGGVFLHTNPWVVIAEALLGNGDRAYDYYSQINPATKNERIDEYECEPYVYAQNILGDEHPQFGLARNSWLSGTAAWAYQAGTQYILGIRPSFAGLSVDPCIPRAWDGFRVTRVFRGATYDITVENPDHLCRGVHTLQVDGATVSGNVIPALDGKHTVRAVIEG